MSSNRKKEVVRFALATIVAGMSFAFIASTHAASPTVEGTPPPAAATAPPVPAARPVPAAPHRTDDRSTGSLVVQSTAVKTNIELWAGRVRDRMKVIEGIKSTYDLKQVTNQKLAVKELRELLGEFDLAAAEIEQTFDRAGPDLKQYRLALEQAPAVFHRYADDMEAKAQAIESPTLKEGYVDMSARARNMAAFYAGRAKMVDSWEADIRSKMKYVVESRVFIQDAQGFLDAIPEGGLETEQLAANMNRYIQAFNEALKAMQGVADKICEPESKAGSAKTTEAPVPAKSAVSAKVETYRTRLTALQR